jgi:hypothetical protein
VANWWDQSTDIGRTNDQSQIRSLAALIGGGNNNAGIGAYGRAMQGQLGAGFAANGMFNSGAHAGGQGALLAQLLQMRSQDQMSRAQLAGGLYSSVGERPGTNGESTLNAFGGLLGMALPFLGSAFGKGGIWGKS